MSEEIKFDHFKDINELLKHIDLWYRDDDIEYTRWFGLEDLHILKIYITSLQQKVEQLEKELTIMVEDDERSQETIINQSKKIKQLENINKQVIDLLIYVSRNIRGLDDKWLVHLIDDKLNILNKGSEKNENNIK